MPHSNHIDERFHFEYHQPTVDALVQSPTPVLLFNGHMRTSKDFKFFIKNLLGRGVPVLTCDYPTTDKPYTFYALIESCELFLKQKGVTSCHVVGFSMGGFIAQGLTLKNPSMVKTLALVSSSCELSYVDPSLEPWSTSLEEIIERLSRYVSQDFLVTNGLLLKGMAKQMQQEIQNENYNGRSLTQRQAFFGFDLFSLGLKDSVQCPVLVIHGTLDRIVPFESAKNIENTYSKVQIISYEGVGHLPLAEVPKRLYQDLMDFFEKNCI